MWLWPWRKRIFVSYSSEDHDLVWSVVRLLRWSRGHVFFAPDSIPLGDTWREEIRRSIKKCKVFLIFWCSHSAESAEVEKEYRIAIELEKSIVPVILDRTPTPNDISKYEGLDFRFESHTNADRLKSGMHVDPETPRALYGGPIHVLRPYARVRSRATLLIFFGIAFVIAAILRPISVPFESELINIFNAQMILLGLVIVYFGIRTFFVARREVKQTTRFDYEIAEKLDNELFRF